MMNDDRREKLNNLLGRLELQLEQEDIQEDHDVLNLIGSLTFLSLYFDCSVLVTKELISNKYMVRISKDSSICCINYHEDLSECMEESYYLFVEYLEREGQIKQFSELPNLFENEDDEEENENPFQL